MPILDRFDLTGRTAIVTGAGSNLGREMSLALAAAGADIVGAGRRLEPLEETGAMVREHDRQFLARPTDVTSSEDVNGLVADAIAEFDTNLTSAFFCSRAIVEHFVEHGFGRIINVTSGWGYRGQRHRFMYPISKAGVISLTKALAMSYARDGVRSTCIAPGAFPHEMTDEVNNRAGLQPAGRFGRLEEIGPLAVFLASDAADYMSGETVLIDGGAIAAGLTPAGMVPTIEEGA